MIAFKGFQKALKCRGYQFVLGEWSEEKKAGCASCGFHAAENPLDCLSYYPHFPSNTYCLVECEGDLDEDGHDSKIACTRIRPIRILNAAEFVFFAVNYIIDHPQRALNSCVQHDTGHGSDNGFEIVIGEHPKAKGKFGDVIALIRTEGGNIAEVVYFDIDGEKRLPGKYYTVSEDHFLIEEGGDCDV